MNQQLSNYYIIGPATQTMTVKHTFDSAVISVLLWSCSDKSRSINRSITDTDSVSCRGREKVHALTWSLTFRLSTSTTLFCRKEKSCAWDSDSPPYALETQALWKLHRDQWRTSQQTKKAQTLSVRPEKEKRKKGKVSLNPGRESNLQHPHNNKVLGLDLITQQWERRLAE